VIFGRVAYTVEPYLSSRITHV